MKFMETFLEKFAKLNRRERLLAVGAAAVVIYFAIDMLLLTPQQKEIDALRQQDKALRMELAAINKALAEEEQSVRAETASSARDRAALDLLRKEIADADAIHRELDTAGPQLGRLVKDLLDASPELTLVSLKTLPMEPFNGADKPVGGAGISIKEGTHDAIYKYGVEVAVKGKYMALLPYMDKLQKSHAHLFWSDARLEVSAYPDAVLKLVLYSLEKQPGSPLG